MQAAAGPDIAHPTAAGGASAHADAADLEPLAAQVLGMVLYFDVFRHPLTEPELTRLVRPGDPAAVARACDTLLSRGLLEGEGGWRHRPGTVRNVARRRSRARHAERVWPWAHRAARFLRSLPWVRGLLVTGSLSKNSAVPDGDVDFLVMVRPGRVWTLKTMLQGLRRALPHPARELFCTNYLMATDRLEVDDQNLFTAVELATAVPLAGREACVALLEANDWAREFVPGLDWSIARAAALPPDDLPPPGEAAAAGRVEAAAMRAFDRYWDRKYDWLDAGVRSQRFKRRTDVATNHLHDFQGYVLREVDSRYRAVGLDRPLSRGALPAGLGMEAR